MKCLLAFQFTIFNLCLIYAISFTEFWPSQHWPFHFHSNICKKDFCMICISSQMTSKHRAQVELWYRLRLKLEFFSYLLSLSHWRLLNLFTCKKSDFFKMGPPRPLSRLFFSIETNITIFTTNNRKNAHPVYWTGIRTHSH